jgi:hypothetical protein
MLANQSHRWHTIFSDSVHLLTGRRKLSDFLSRRNIYKRLTGSIGQSKPASDRPDDAVAEHLAGRRYREEILDRLRDASSDYDAPHTMTASSCSPRPLSRAAGFSMTRKVGGASSRAGSILFRLPETIRRSFWIPAQGRWPTSSMPRSPNRTGD